MLTRLNRRDMLWHRSSNALAAVAIMITLIAFNSLILI